MKSDLDTEPNYSVYENNKIYDIISAMQTYRERRMRDANFPLYEFSAYDTCGGVVSRMPSHPYKSSHKYNAILALELICGWVHSRVPGEGKKSIQHPG